MENMIGETMPQGWRMYRSEIWMNFELYCAIWTFQTLSILMQVKELTVFCRKFLFKVKFVFDTLKN